MSLEIPTLDDREYADILEDARKAIAVHSTDWTDHNAHDPGITILELLAWLAETYGYQFDRVTEPHRRAYLRLAGRPLRRPTTSTATLQFAPAVGAHGVTVPAGTPLVAIDGANVVRSFETVRGVRLTGATLETVLSDYPSGRADHSESNRRAGVSFFAFGEAGGPGSALYLGFAGDPFAPAADAAGEAPPLSLTFDYAADIPESAPAFAVDLPTLSVDERLSAMAERNDTADATGATGTVGEDTLQSADADSLTRTESVFTPTVPLVWEYCTNYDRSHDPSVWESESLVVAADWTNRLYESGTVTLALRDQAAVAEDRRWPTDPGRLFDTTTERHWLRCRIRDTAAGPGSSYEAPPRFDTIRVNVVTAVQRATVADETLARADGGTRTSARLGQRFQFRNTPVLRASVTVGGEEWTPVAHFDASDADDLHYVLDHQSGVLRFGDGVRGRIPPADVPVVAASYTWGGGTAANLSGSASWRLAGDDAAQPPSPALSAAVDEIRPLTPAVGGSDAESVDDALEELQRDLDTPYRTVTATDARDLALATPGLRFGRAHAVATSSPDADQAGCAPGATLRVVVIPYSPATRPVPSDGFLDAVRQHLRRHTLLTDRVTVEPPTYVDVDVTTTVQLAPRSNPTASAEAVERRVERFLNPLSGFDGTGWPFGRSLYLSELYETIGGVDGVDCVLDVDITTAGRSTRDADGNVVIDDLALLAPRSVTVLVESTREQCGGVR